jgi:hypothetical protein
VPREDCDHRPFTDPRKSHLCRKCGAKVADKLPEMAVDNGATRPRNLRLEHELIDLAAQAAGYTTDGGLRRYADWRAKPGDVIIKDNGSATRDKLADAANYVLWDLEQIHLDYLRGDPEAADDYERLLRTLSHIQAAWNAYHTASA